MLRFMLVTVLLGLIVSIWNITLFVVKLIVAVPVAIVLGLSTIGAATLINRKE